MFKYSQLKLCVFLFVGALVSFGQARGITVFCGQQIQFMVSADTGLPYDIQWFKDGYVQAGETNPTFAVTAAQSPESFRVHVRVGNNAGAAFSKLVYVQVIQKPGATTVPRGFSNISIRSVAGQNGQPLTVGFSPSGDGGSPLLLRASGPVLALSPFNVAGVMSDPALTLFEGKVPIAYNNNWGDYTAASFIQYMVARVGAFGIADTRSLDSAMFVLATKGMTVQIASAQNSSERGVVLFEAYDCAINPVSQISNASAMNYAGTGNDTLILGFTVSGSDPVKVLIRGVGPGLVPFGVSNSLADPRIELHGFVDGKDKVIASNDDWGGGADMVSAFSAAGAFSLSTASKDAALLVTLAPGNYSALLSGPNASTGIALVEIYNLSTR